MFSQNDLTFTECRFAINQPLDRVAKTVEWGAGEEKGAWGSSTQAGRCGSCSICSCKYVGVTQSTK